LSVLSHFPPPFSIPPSSIPGRFRFFSRPTPFPPPRKRSRRGRKPGHPASTPLSFWAGACQLFFKLPPSADQPRPNAFFFFFLPFSPIGVFGHSIVSFFFFFPRAIGEKNMAGLQILRPAFLPLFPAFSLLSFGSVVFSHSRRSPRLYDQDAMSLSVSSRTVALPPSLFFSPSLASLFSKISSSPNSVIGKKLRKKREVRMYAAHP